MAGKLGRLGPHPESTHPRLKAAQFLRPQAVTVPATVDYLANVTDWPVYLNDQIGDCTCAAIGHMIEAWTRYGEGTTEQPTDDQVLAVYEAVSGYDPRTGANDNGAVMQDVLSYVHKRGMGGHEVLAYAQLDVSDMAEVKMALYLFGHVYLGINFPDSAMTQFDEGKPWDVVRRARIEGGHAIDLGRIADGANHQVVTWGRVQPMTQAFFDTYVEEAWVVLSAEWVNNAHAKAPEGLDVAALNTAYHDLTGEAGPFPVQPDPGPTPEPPGPAPQPGPDAATVAAAIRQTLTDLGL